MLRVRCHFFNVILIQMLILRLKFFEDQACRA